MEDLPATIAEFVASSNQRLLDQAQRPDPARDRELSQRYFALENELDDTHDRLRLRWCLPSHVVNAVVSGRGIQDDEILAGSSRASALVTAAARIWEVPPAVCVFHLCAEARGRHFFQAVGRLADICGDWELANARIQTIASRRRDLASRATKKTNAPSTKDITDAITSLSSAPEMSLSLSTSQAQSTVSNSCAPLPTGCMSLTSFLDRAWAIPLGVRRGPTPRPTSRRKTRFRTRDTSATPVTVILARSQTTPATPTSPSPAKDRKPHRARPRHPSETTSPRNPSKTTTLRFATSYRTNERDRLPR